jgi:hypothetical protein
MQWRIGLLLNANGIEAIEALFAQPRGFAQRCARDAAVFLHIVMLAIELN